MAKLQMQTVIHRTELKLTPESPTLLPLENYRRAIHLAPHRDPSKRDSWIEVWYEAYVYEAEPVETMHVRFHVHGTGHPFDHETGGLPPANLGVTHLGTVATHGGSGIWHVYVEYPIRGA